MTVPFISWCGRLHGERRPRRERRDLGPVVRSSPRTEGPLRCRPRRLRTEVVPLMRSQSQARLPPAEHLVLGAELCFLHRDGVWQRPDPSGSKSVSRTPPGPSNFEAINLPQIIHCGASHGHRPHPMCRATEMTGSMTAKLWRRATDVVCGMEQFPATPSGVGRVRANPYGPDRWRRRRLRPRARQERDVLAQPSPSNCDHSTVGTGRPTQIVQCIPRSKRSKPAGCGQPQAFTAGSLNGRVGEGVAVVLDPDSPPPQDDDSQQHHTDRDPAVAR